MQYHLNAVVDQKNKKGIEELNLKKKITMIFLVLISSFLVSRVVIYLDITESRGIAPLGIAMYMAILLKWNKELVFLSYFGVQLGYISIWNHIEGQYLALMITTLLLIYNLLFSRSKKLNKEYIYFGIVIVGYLLYGIIYEHYTIRISGVLALINGFIIIPTYYIARYVYDAIKEFNDGYLLSTEEMMSVGIIICMMVCGIGEVAVYGVSIRFILANTMVIVFAYTGGTLYGALIGSIIGLILGGCNNDIFTSVGFFSLLGLVSGVFKELGKVCTSISYLIVYLSSQIYINNFNKIIIIEIGISIAIFLLVPKRVFEAVEVEVSMDKKRVKLGQFEISELKEEFTDKVKSLGVSLITISNVLHSMSNNDVSEISKSELLIENLADRVCSKCDRADYCWKKNFDNTYISFEEVIENSENKKGMFPKHLEKNCLQKIELIRNADNLVNNDIRDNIKKQALDAGRLLLADHIEKISLSIDKMLDDFKRELMICGDLERIIRKSFDRKSIKYKGIFCYRDSNGRVVVKLTFKQNAKDSVPDKDIIELINNVIAIPMSICSEACRYDVENNMNILVLKEMPKYKVISYGAVSAKDGEDYMGDTYSFGKTKDGNYMIVISDGMGTGRIASLESGMTVEIIERFFESGFDCGTSVNMVNSVMDMRLEETERYSTLDLSMLNLYTGQAEFIKVGAAPSFIKRGKQVKIISSSMPPFGVVDEFEADPVKINLKSDDLIINISDGILDVSKKIFGNSSWIENYLLNSTKDPKKLAEDILKTAKELSGNISRDDMTVVVSKVSMLY